MTWGPGSCPQITKGKWQLQERARMEFPPTWERATMLRGPEGPLLGEPKSPHT